MKIWKHFIFFTAIVFTFIACDNSAGINNTVEQPQFRETSLTIHADWSNSNYPERTTDYTPRVQGTVTNDIWDNSLQKIKAALESAIYNCNLPMKSRFNNEFGSSMTDLALIPDLTIVKFPLIILDTNADYESYKLDNKTIVRLNVDYVSNVTVTDLESVFTTAVMEMDSASLDPSGLPNGFWFIIDDKLGGFTKGMISGNTISSSMYLTIPSNINGVPVTEISSYAFHGNDFITGVTIPNGAFLEGTSRSFAECSNLASVTIEGESIRGIDGYDSNPNALRCFDGDLELKYKAGGNGTYTTTRTGDGSDFDTAVWVKQQ